MYLNQLNKKQKKIIYKEVEEEEEEEEIVYIKKNKPKPQELSGVYIVISFPSSINIYAQL